MTGARAAGAADMDGDFDIDMLGAGGMFNGASHLAWYENDASQSFAAHELASTGEVHADLVAADVDGDADQVPFAA